MATEAAEPKAEELKDPGIATEEVPVKPKVPIAKNRKTAGAKAPPCLEVMAARIEQLHDEADQADAAIAAEVKKLEELQAKIATMRSEAEAKRAAAQRASQEYLKKKCEASIAQLEACVPKRAPNPFVMFCQEVSVPGVSSIEQNQVRKEKWANLSPEEKQKYQDRHKEASRKYNEWGSSEEGQKNLRERNELRRQCKTEGMEELGKAVSDLKNTPTKRAQDVEEHTPTKDRVVKQRRVAPVRASPPTKEPSLDEKVLEEAGKANLSEQLRNLAARPDVLALGKSSQELWDALQAHNGMVNATKHALLSS